jgi:hypothetical protein
VTLESAVARAGVGGAGTIKARLARSYDEARQVGVPNEEGVSHMKAGLMTVTVFGVAAALACAAVAADKPKHEGAAKRDAPAKPDAPAKQEMVKKQGERADWRGTLAAPGADAAADVVAILKMTRRDEEKTVALKVADAALAATVKELAGKGAMVSVKGKLAEDGKSIDVTACTEAKDKPRGEREHARPEKAGKHDKPAEAGAVK